MSALYSNRAAEPELNKQVVNVRPYQKLYLDVMPGSCPPERPRQMEDIAYEQKYGKGPLMQERADRIRRLQEAKNEITKNQI